MEIRRKEPRDVTVGYECDICHQSCSRWNGDTSADTAEFATLFAEWGYFSDDKDMTWHKCHMCDPCFMKVKRFIEEELKGTVRSGPLGFSTVISRSPEAEEHT